MSMVCAYQPASNVSLFVVYGAGPHGNGVDRGVRLARLRRPVKMIGGMTGWLDDGFGL